MEERSGREGEILAGKSQCWGVLIVDDWQRIRDCPWREVIHATYICLGGAQDAKQPETMDCVPRFTVGKFRYTSYSGRRRPVLA